MLFPWFLIVSVTFLLQSKAEPLAIRDLCPHTRFCTDEPLSILNDSDTRPCCMQCSCSWDCRDFGNCCPDKSAGFTIPQPIPCRTQEEIYGQYLNRSFLDLSREKLKVIDTCPEEAYTKPELETAAHRCHNGKELDDLFFVSDENDKIYLNRFCAECNGVIDFTTWTLLTPCHQITQETFFSFEELTDIILNTCNVISKPPKGFDFRNSICLIDIITQCNVTGMWDFYDHEIKRQCESYKLPYAFSIHDAYANVHCFMCNNPRHTNIYSKCDLLDLKISEFTSGPIGVFTAILNLRGASKFKQTQALEETHRCTDTDVFDPFMKQCLQLFCPLGTLPSQGTCKSVFDVADGNCVAIIFEIQEFSHQKKNMLRTNARKLGDSVKELVRKESKSLGIACGLSAVSVFESFTSNLFVSVSLFSTPTCEYVRLVLVFDKLAKKKTLEVQIDDENVSLPLLQAQTWPYIFTEYWVEEPNMCLPSLFTKHTVHCPSIEYRRADILQHTTRDIADKLFEISVKVDENKYRICLDDYGTELNSGSHKVPFVIWIGYALSIYCVLSL